MRGVRIILFVNQPQRVMTGLESMETGLESMETTLDTLGMPGEMRFECGDKVIVDKPSSTFDRPVIPWNSLSYLTSHSYLTAHVFILIS